MDQFVEKKRTLFFGLPWTFTTYFVGEELLKKKEGFLSLRENSCYLYKIQDVTLTRSVWERIFKLSTIICYTGDTTDPTLELKHIRNGEAIRDFLVKTSDDERMKRRTVNTLHIDADEIGDGIQ